MEWMKWLIPAIAVAVWILSRLAAQQQDQRRVVPPPRPFPPDPDDEPRGRRASAELERFLEEVKRRKEAEENAPVEPILIAEEVPARRSGPPPLPRPVEQRPVEQRRKSVPVGRSSKRRDDPVMVIQPIADPPLPSRAVAMPSSVPAAVQPTQALPPPPTAPQAPQAIHRPEALPTQRAVTPTMKLVRELLKNRQTLATAFLLREVFDRPRCRRPLRNP